MLEPVFTPEDNQWWGRPKAWGQGQAFPKHIAYPHHQVLLLFLMKDNSSVITLSYNY